MRMVDKDALVVALDQLLHRADVTGWPEAEAVVEALGWPDKTEMPDAVWFRLAIGQALR